MFFMKIIVTAMLLFCSVLPALALEPGELSSLLPVDNAVSGWVRRGEADSFAGENLFMMIDGGADIYHEYGFKEVVRADYTNGSDQTMTVEIYQMTSPAAAYGIYSFKIGSDGHSVAIGNAAFLEDYYVNFWKGDLLVTIIGSTAEPEIVTAIQQLGRVIAEGYPHVGYEPDLAGLLTREPFALTSPIYVRGDLAVMNSYVFDAENIFHVREGIIGWIEGCRVFVLKYPDSTASGNLYKSALARMTAGIRFSDAVVTNSGTLLTGRKQEQVMVSVAGQFITVVIGDSRAQIAHLTTRVQGKLNHLPR